MHHLETSTSDRASSRSSARRGRRLRVGRSFAAELACFRVALSYRKAPAAKRLLVSGLSGCCRYHVRRWFGSEPTFVLDAEQVGRVEVTWASLTGACRGRLSGD